MHFITIIWFSLAFIVSFQNLSHAQDVKKGAETLHILYYENIEFEEDPYQFINGIPLEDFKHHLEFINNDAYQVIALSDLDKETIIPFTANKKYIALILNSDDAEAINYAIPLLKRYGYPVNFNVNPLKINDKITKNTTKNSFVLNISKNNEASVFIEKILNDETSRFREKFNETPSSVLINDAPYYKENKMIFNRYGFTRIYIPSSEGNSIYAMNKELSYIPVTPSFSNLDVLATHLNRQPFHYSNLTMTKNDNKVNDKIEISWGVTLPYAIDMIKDNIECMTSKGEKAMVHALDNRVEIRAFKQSGSDAITIHCTCPIYNEYSNKTDSYRYMTLYEAP